MEDRVAQDRSRVVVQPDEGGHLEAFGVMHAEHDAVHKRVEEETDQDREDG